MLGVDADELRARILILGLNDMASDHKVLVELSDTTARFLKDKVKQGTNISIVVKNPSGDEYLEVDIGPDVATKSYADNAADGALDDAKDYTDSVAIATLNSANTYADNGDTATLSAANTHADNGDASTLSDANDYTDSKIPVGTKGATLMNNGTNYQPITFDTAIINSDNSQAPTVADGHTFFVDAVNLTADRDIVPDDTGAAETETITFIVANPTSGGGFKYSLVTNITKVLSSKIMVQCVFSSGIWRQVSFQPYEGSL